METENDLLRQVSVAGINVYYNDDTGKYHLVEEKQVFHDGRERRRKLDASVSEKMIAGELPDTAFRRGLQEELPEITQELGEGWVNDITFENTHALEDVRSSPSYPGLNSKYRKFLCDVTFSPKEYRPNGYMEVQGDKTTYFMWEKVLPPSSPPPQNPIV